LDSVDSSDLKLSTNVFKPVFTMLEYSELFPATSANFDVRFFSAVSNGVAQSFSSTGLPCAYEQTERDGQPGQTDERP